MENQGNPILGYILLGIFAMLVFAPAILAASRKNTWPEILIVILCLAALLFGGLGLYTLNIAASAGMMSFFSITAPFLLLIAGLLWFIAMIIGCAVFIANVLRRAMRMHAARMILNDPRGLPAISPYE